jgi:hypothetical protein
MTTPNINLTHDIETIDYRGHRLAVYRTHNNGILWTDRWNVRYREPNGNVPDFIMGDPFGALTKQRAINKAKRYIDKITALHARDDALRQATR